MGAVNPRPSKGGGVLPRRQQRSLVTAGQILAAASAEFAAKGLAGARVDEIARRAGVNKRMLYHYFGNKEALWLAVLEHAYDGIRKEERGLDVGRLPPEEGMRRLVEFSVRYCADHPEFLTLLNSENLHKAKYLKRSTRMPELHSALLQVIADLLERGQRAGVFRQEVDPAELYIHIAALGFFYFSNIHTLSVIFERDLNAPRTRRRHIKQAAEVILGYLRP
ncbi:MAG: TetR/AcrR family transcriptional regulator [Candidatus Eiseniibacteriota bacterium]